MARNKQRRRAAKRRGRVANLAAAARGGPSASGIRTEQDAAGATGRVEAAPAERAQMHADPEIVLGRLIADGAIRAFGDGADDVLLDRIVESLVVLQSAEQPLLPARLATDRLLGLVGQLWDKGWQPLDLVHVVRRHQGKRAVGLVTALIVEQAGRERAAERAPDEWVAQLESLGGRGRTDGVGARTSSAGWLVTRWQADQGIVSWDGWRDTLGLFGQLQGLHRLTPVGALPAQWDRLRAATGDGKAGPTAQTGSPCGPATDHDPRMLGKIRALLSKAEATTFVDEAAALTAKAQHLMTRYAIDEALLEDSAGTADVKARRIHIDNPYAQAKVQLLTTVGGVNRVRVVWDDQHGMATVVGMAVDLQLIEMLFTSLLVQATTALTDAGNAPPPTAGYRSGRLNRSPSFRRAFLLSYANRIGERLVSAGDRASAEAGSSHGADLVKVIARRTAAVDGSFERLFPDTREMRVSRVDARGWHAGRAAADRAVFAAGQVTDR